MSAAQNLALAPLRPYVVTPPLVEQNERALRRTVGRRGYTVACALLACSGVGGVLGSTARREVLALCARNRWDVDAIGDELHVAGRTARRLLRAWGLTAAKVRAERRAAKAEVAS